MNFKKILIIEDDKNSCDLLEKIIMDKDLTILKENNGLAGFKSICQNKPDLIFLDIKMPEMDGLELITKLADEKIKIPILLVSGAEEFYFNIAKIYGVEHYIRKPFSAKEVRSKLKVLSH